MVERSAMTPTVEWGLPLEVALQDRGVLAQVKSQSHLVPIVARMGFLRGRCFAMDGVGWVGPMKYQDSHSPRESCVARLPKFQCATELHTLRRSRLP